MRTFALALLLSATPGCATIAAAALGAEPSTVRAAGDLDAAMLAPLVAGGESGAHGSSSGGIAVASGPTYLCDIPHEAERQEIEASSAAGAERACAGMNAMGPGEACTCREVEQASALGEPIATR